MDNKIFRKWNLAVGAVVFAISAFTYLSTIEPTASFWDCGEFIASSYKLEVGHPPGNPVFQLIARLFTMFTGPDKAAVMVNSMSALCSALTIFFLYLTIVFFVKRLIPAKKKPDGTPDEYSLADSIAIFCALDKPVITVEASTPEVSSTPKNVAASLADIPSSLSAEPFDTRLFARVFISTPVFWPMLFNVSKNAPASLDSNPKLAIAFCTESTLLDTSVLFNSAN